MDTMISVQPDVLSRILALRTSETESLDNVLRRNLPPIGAAPVRRTTQPAPKATVTSARGLAFEIDGELHRAADASEAMIVILRHFDQYDDNFLPKLEIEVRTPTRNHIARSRSAVYPGRPHLTHRVKQLRPGWFIGCNIDNGIKARILRTACELMGVSFGEYIKIDLPNS